MLFALFAAAFLGFSFASNYLRARSRFWEVLVETVDGIIPRLVAIDVRALTDASDLPDIA